MGIVGFCHQNGRLDGVVIATAGCLGLVDLGALSLFLIHHVLHNWLSLQTSS